MKRYMVFLVIAVFTVTSCGLVKKKVLIDYVINEKEKLDQTDNPARRYLIKRELSKKRITITDVVVKDVTESTNIDYDFCIIVEVPTEKGIVECYVYSANVRKISKLVKNKTKIDVTGEFGRFFTLLDEYYTKIEIVKASIAIKE